MKKAFIVSSLKIAAAIIVAVILCNFSFYSLESYFYDARFRLAPYAENTNSVVLVKIDKKSLAMLGRNPNLIDLGLAVKSIQSDIPRAIVSLANIDISKASLAEKSFFAQVSETTRSFVMAYDDIVVAGEEAKLKLPHPLENVPMIQAPQSTDKSNFAGDDVSRRTLIYYDGHYFLPALLAGIDPRVTQPQDLQGSFVFRESYQTLTNFRKKGSFESFQPCRCN